MHKVEYTESYDTETLLVCPAKILSHFLSRPMPSTIKLLPAFDTCYERKAKKARRLRGLKVDRLGMRLVTCNSSAALQPIHLRSRRLFRCAESLRRNGQPPRLAQLYAARLRLNYPPSAALPLAWLSANRSLCIFLLYLIRSSKRKVNPFRPAPHFPTFFL